MGKLTNKIKWAYAVGQFGWSILSGIIQVWLVWFYNPPSTVDIPAYIPRGSVFGFLTVIGLITMLGRLMDSITDPWIAGLSDRSKNPKGRRIPFMKVAAVPFTVLTLLVFLPPSNNLTINTFWLTTTLLLYYIFFTMYVTPYFALTSELGKTEKERIDLSTYIALTWFLGYIVASGAAYIWPIFVNMGYSLTTSIRITLALLCIVGFIFMMIPVLFIDEKKYVDYKPSSVNFMKSIKSTLSNKNFLIFEIFFLAYGIAITIFQTGNVYYVSVLLQLNETWVTIVTALTGIIAFLLYPAVNKFSKIYGKKKLCVFAMIMLILAYFYCSFLGIFSFSVTIQAIIFVLLAGVGFAVFGILPNAICADIAHYDGIRTGENKAGMYFAVQTFMNKLGQMIAMVAFSSILLLGKDVGDDLGIRLTGVVAAIIGGIALVIFMKYEEQPSEEEQVC
ncbi:MFS transporter [Caldisalinibacter kiritimatiensis]|uniref:Major facilitator superfamily MFS_1 n=1 Tax=Caldisalinibacter kiritimatiensis TaxID=1304284 RepID=R1CLC9_9FIRM|nr:MFS transporter [Caldisalinibacter kiritimatiensis]EOC99480.1 major facilitator superfamily MFS_1 [Caldisalinibacter kiritimatiensis]